MAASGWQLLHAIAGRIRLRIEKVRHNPVLAQQLHQHIAAIQGVQEVRVNPRTGSVLILYDPGFLKVLRPGTGSAAQRQVLLQTLVRLAEILSIIPEDDEVEPIEVCLQAYFNGSRPLSPRQLHAWSKRLVIRETS